MLTPLEIIALFLWVILGACGYIHWLHVYYDFELKHFVPLILVSLAGPIVWVCGWIWRKHFHNPS